MLVARLCFVPVSVFGPWLPLCFVASGVELSRVGSRIILRVVSELLRVAGSRNPEHKAKCAKRSANAASAIFVRGRNGEVCITYHAHKPKQYV